ncbi:MAG: hypothetical protein E6X85_06420 [Veillonella sp.]|nr:hypothetical protein [Veillonella sp.]MDU4763746.1 hypothetical protein [Veillonella sp.]
MSSLCHKGLYLSHRIASHRIASHRIASHRIASHRHDDTQFTYK